MKAGNRKNEGDVVKSFLDGELYRINGSDEKAVELSHVQESENDDGKKYFTPTSEKPVTVRSCVFDEFFYLYEKAPAKAPENGEFVIRDGVLLRNGKKVECGTLVPLEIKALIPGAVILTVRSREEGRMDLFHYNVEEDAFSKLANAKSDLELVYRHKDVTGFIVTEMETITICNEEDDSPEKVETIKQSIRYYRGEKKIFSSDAGWSAFPVVGSWVPCSVNTCSDPVTHVQLFQTSHALRLVKDECGTEYYVHDAENDGKRTMVTKVDLAYYDEVSDPLVTIYCIEFPGLIGQILPCNDEDHNFVFVTEKPAGIIHSNYGHFYRRAVGEEVSSVVQDHPIPLSLSPMSPCDTIFAFGNRNYELCRIRVVKTRDRGFVTTIEEIK